MKQYLAIFIWHGDDGATWSIDVDTLDKQTIVDELFKKGNHDSLDWAEILVLENGDPTGTLVANKDGEMTVPELNPPKVVKHWSALNGDFEGM